jgi:hypothetical protein
MCNTYRAKEVNCVFATDVMRSVYEYSFSLFVVLKGIYVHVNKVSEVNYLFKLLGLCIYFPVFTVLRRRLLMSSL